MSLEHSRVPKSKDVLKSPHNDKGMSKGHRSLQSSPRPKAEQFEQQNK